MEKQIGIQGIAPDLDLFSKEYEGIMLKPEKEYLMAVYHILENDKLFSPAPPEIVNPGLWRTAEELLKNDPVIEGQILFDRLLTFIRGLYDKLDDDKILLQARVQAWTFGLSYIEKYKMYEPILREQKVRLLTREEINLKVKFFMIYIRQFIIEDYREGFAVSIPSKEYN